jgi:hypothetical protein
VDIQLLKTMEASQPLATESFSYSWLSNVRPTLDGLDRPFRASLDSSHAATSKESDYRVIKSRRCSEESQDFDFEILTSQSPPLAHADELFSNGVIKPVSVDPSRLEVSNYSNNNPAMPSSSSSSRIAIQVVQDNSHFLRWKKPLERILLKCFGCFRPSCHKIKGSRKCTRVDDIDRRVSEVKRWSNSPQASPQPSIVCSTGDCCDRESSIYEAVLHCKRSIGLLILSF